MIPGPGDYHAFGPPLPGDPDEGESLLQLGELDAMVGWIDYGDRVEIQGIAIDGRAVWLDCIHPALLAEWCDQIKAQLRAEREVAEEAAEEDYP